MTRCFRPTHIFNFNFQRREIVRRFMLHPAVTHPRIIPVPEIYHEMKNTIEI